MSKIILIGVIVAVSSLLQRPARADHYYVFQNDRAGVGVIDLDAINWDGSIAIETELSEPLPSGDMAQTDAFATREVEYDCKAKTFTTSYEGSVGFDGRILSRKPLPMAPFRPARWVFRGLRRIDVVCGKAKPPASQMLTATPTTIGGMLKRFSAGSK